MRKWWWIWIVGKQWDLRPKDLSCGAMKRGVTCHEHYIWNKITSGGTSGCWVTWDWESPHRSDVIFCLCERVKREWNEKRAKGPLIQTTNKKMVADLSVEKANARQGVKKKSRHWREKKDRSTQIPNTVEKSRVKKTSFFNIGIAVHQPCILGVASVYSPHTGPYPYSIPHFLCHR